MRENRANRCTHEIVYELLKNMASEEPKNITSLCRAVNLPVDRGIKVINVLMKSGLVASYTITSNSKVGKLSRYYIVTEVGYEYIGIYERLKELFNPFERFPTSNSHKI